MSNPQRAMPLHTRGYGAFANSAMAMLEAGLCPIPCGGSDGKTPLVKNWNNLQRPYTQETIRGWAEKFCDANVGIVCGISGVAVVDIDKPDYLDEVMERFGPTPLIVRTPRGGRHLYYRADRTDLRPSKLFAKDNSVIGDIKAGPSFVVAPPSVRPEGNKYSFDKGDWSFVGNLPIYRENSDVDVREGNIHPFSKIPEGRRNSAAFKYALQQASYCDTEEDLLDVVRTYAARHFEHGPCPLSEAELRKTVGSAWGYEQDGRNWSGSKGAAVIENEALDRFMKVKVGADAFLILCDLRRNHSHRNQPFALVVRSYITRFSGLSERRCKAAILLLLQFRLIQRVRVGGRGPGDPHRYMLLGRGSNSTPNVIDTLSPGKGLYAAT